MTRPCGCQRDPAVFGHWHGGATLATLMTCPPACRAQHAIPDADKIHVPGDTP